MSSGQYTKGEISENSYHGYDIEILDEAGDVICYLHSDLHRAEVAEEALNGKADALLSHLNR